MLPPKPKVVFRHWGSFFAAENAMCNCIYFWRGMSHCTPDNLALKILEMWQVTEYLQGLSPIIWRAIK